MTTNEDRLDGYISGELDPNESAEIESEIENDAETQASVTDQLATDRALKELLRSDKDSDVALVKSIRARLDVSKVRHKSPLPHPAKPVNSPFSLRINTGSHAGDDVWLDRDSFIIGRSKKADIPLPDNGASRQHARLSVSAAKILIEDLGSSNGTLVNGEKIGAQLQLKPGDHVRIGDTDLILCKSAKKGQVRLVGIDGPVSGEEFVFADDRVVIGRGSSAQIRIPDHASSRENSAITHDNGRYLLSDLGSSNGTLLNGRRITGRPLLRDGDTIQIGKCVFEFVNSHIAEIGERDIPGFTILKRIGRGSLGMVYKARRHETDEIVALKVIDPAITADAKSRARLLNAARNASRIDHPNVLPVLDVGTHDDCVYLSSIWAANGSLATMIEDPDDLPPYTVTLAIALDVIRGITAGEEAGLTHHGLRPGDILIDGNGIGMVSDFGLSANFDNQLPDPKANHYRSTEELSGKAATQQSLQFTLGAIMYHALTGQQPFAGNAARDTAEGTHTEELEAIRDYNDAVPKPLANTIAKMMARRPEDRYADWDELCSDLEGIVRQGVNAQVKKPAPGVSALGAETGIKRSAKPASARARTAAPFRSRDRMPKSIRTLLTVSAILVGLLILIPITQSILRRQAAAKELANKPKQEQPASITPGVISHNEGVRERPDRSRDSASAPTITPDEPVPEPQASVDIVAPTRADNPFGARPGVWENGALYLSDGRVLVGSFLVAGEAVSFRESETAPAQILTTAAIATATFDPPAHRAVADGDHSMLRQQYDEALAYYASVPPELRAHPYVVERMITAIERRDGGASESGPTSVEPDETLDTPATTNDADTPATTPATASAPMPAVEVDAGQAFDLQGFIDQQVAAGERRIVIPPGRHRVSPNDRTHLRLENLRDIEIIAEDAEMICTETTRAMSIKNCHNVALRGLTIDYDPLPFTQGRIVSMSNNNTVHEIELFEGYPPAAEVREFKYEIYRPDTRTLRYGSYHSFTVQPTGPRSIRVTRRGNYQGEQVGDIIVIGTQHVSGGSIPHGLTINDSSNVTLEDVTLHASNCFGFFEVNCERTTYLNCRVDRRPLEGDLKPRADARIRSLNADAFHSKHAAVGPQLINCEARFMADDGVNICGEYYLVMGSSGNQVRVLTPRDINIEVGHPVELVTYTGERLEDAKVTAIAPTEGVTANEASFIRQQRMDAGHKDRLQRAKGMLITLDRNVDLPMGSVIASMLHMGNGFLVEGCSFGPNRSRGILIKASNGAVKNNTLDTCMGAAIKVAPEWWWLESGSSNNVEVSGNTVRNCDSGISVYATAGAGGVAPAGAHSNILIENNTVTDTPKRHIWVTSTKRLILRRNSCDADKIEIENCEDVRR